ncbi:MAG: HD domain-containing protein [Bacilli bacterium]|nr:HD domain-containing protein [Bacilli bacterium]
MKIKTMAKKFAIKAHKGQIRKSDKEKPMIIHPINVGNILEEYGFDENVIAAGYLHDVVEDTKYTKEDIEDKFGSDIASLVMGASEPDKSLSWEERKKHTIEEVKKLDLRHKAIVCADKISNLEDLRIISEIKGEYDFCAFKRGVDSQKWYYTEVYNSLVKNEDENLPMFIRLKELIGQVFNNETNDEYVKNIIFKEKEEEYKELIKIHYKKEEIFKLKNVLTKKMPYVIEFTGTPRTGKTTLINNLYDFFKKKGFSVEVLEEFTTSKKYKKEIYPILKDKYKNVINTEIPKYVLKQLEQAVNKNVDIIIIDRSLFDRLIWVDRLVLKSGMSLQEYEDYKKLYIPLIKEKINIVISTYTDSLTALKRDYQANLSLEKRNFLNEDNVNEYNKSLLNMEKLSKKEKINFYMFDTTNKNQREISLDVVNIILNDMRKEFIDRVNKEFN